MHTLFISGPGVKPGFPWGSSVVEPIAAVGKVWWHLKVRLLASIALFAILICGSPTSPTLSGLSSQLGSGEKAQPTPAATVYVSPNGNDAWSGKLDQQNPARNDGPLRTLTRAREAVRQLKMRQPGAAVTVMLRGGLYELSEPLIFNPQDSGTPQSPVVYAAYPGEVPILSGGRQITGWKREDAGLWSAQVPGVREGNWYFHQLFVDSVRRQRARTPNVGSFYNVEGEITFDDPARFNFHDDNILDKWAQQDAEIVGLNQWQEFRMPIRSVDAHAHNVTLSQRIPRTYNEKNPRYWIENTLEALDAPGEWYLNRHKGILYYRPASGEDMTRAEVVAPFVQQLVRFRGDGPDHPVHDITLRGLTLMYADWSMGEDGYVSQQAATDIPAVLDAQAARRIAIEKCKFAHLGTYALAFGNGSKANQIVGNEILDVGAGAVKIGDPHSGVHPMRRDQSGFAPGARRPPNGGPPFSRRPSPGGGAAQRQMEGPRYAEDPADYRAEPNYPNSENETSSENIVSDNRIHDIGSVYPGAVAIWIGQSYGNTISHNEIYDTYYSGISCGWTWGFGPSAAHHNIIEFNIIHNIGRALMSDLGGIYMLGIQPGTILRNNMVYEVRRNPQPGGYAGWGIYLDATASEIRIENNLVYDADEGALLNSQGQENIFANNVFAFGRATQFQQNRGAYKRSFTFEHNLVYYTEGALMRFGTSQGDFVADYNLYYHAGGEVQIRAGREGIISFQEWQSRGQDSHSTIEDPRFVNPEHRNFALRPDSSASKIGFKPFDIGQIGPRH